MSCFTLLLSLFLFTAAVDAQVRSLGDLSFAVPVGWEYNDEPSASRATLSLGQDGQLVVALAIFKPLRSTGNPDSDFRAAWTSAVRTIQIPEPIYEHKSYAGYPGRYASNNTPDGSHYVLLYSLESGGGTIPVLVITTSRQTFDGLEPIISLFVDSVRQLPLKAQAPKTSLTIADLVGEWRSGGDSTLDYVTPSGAYAGSSTVAHGSSYSIAPDGGFRSQFAGIANRQIVRGNSVGTVELASGIIAFHERGGKVSRYHLVSYQTALNGATVLTLLGDQYDVSAANIGFYGEKWVRSTK